MTAQLVNAEMAFYCEPTLESAAHLLCTAVEVFCAKKTDLGTLKIISQEVREFLQSHKPR